MKAVSKMFGLSTKKDTPKGVLLCFVGFGGFAVQLNEEGIKGQNQCIFRDLDLQ